MRATIVICTHNRGSMVARAVDGALADAAASGATVLVVDNASTDDTPAVLAALEARADGHVRVLHEPRLGLSHARNRGLAAADGDVVAFLDDDAVPRAGWLAALLAPYATPDVGCVGGRIRLRFTEPPPDWLTPAFHGALSAFDAGDEPRRLRHGGGDWFPTGANVSFRVGAARAVGGFSTLLGVQGRVPLLHEEHDLCHRLVAAGWDVRYAPDAVVDHWIVPARLRPEWFLLRHHFAGRSAATCALRNLGLLRSLWGVRWYAPFLAASRYAPAEPVDGSRLLAECQRREALGYLRGLVTGIGRLHTLRRDLVPGHEARVHGAP